MGWFRRRLQRREQEADLAEELASHIEIEKAGQRESGKTPEEAERTARALFGNLTATSETVRDTWSWAGVERFLQDCRFGGRLLARSPLWAAAVCLTLALGAGIGTSIFSVVHAVLLKPLPYPEPARIVTLSPTAPNARGERFNPNPALWLDWRANLRSIADLALTRPVANFNLTGAGEPERLQGARFTFNLPRVLGVHPKFGRLFTEAEQRADAQVVLLSHFLWTRRFGGDPAIVGRKLLLNGRPNEVVGIMPPEFEYPDATFQIWAPLFLPPHDLGHGYNYGSFVTGRLAKGVTIAQAQAEVDAGMRRLADQFPGAYRAGGQWIGGLVEPLAQRQAAAVKPVLMLLAAAVASLLSIGCLNLALLMIARANGRAKEMLVRAALGASNARLRRQLLAEAIPLGVVGSAGGLLLAAWLLRLLVSMLPPGFPRIGAVGVNPVAAAFAVGSGAGVVLISSLISCRVAGSAPVSAALQSHSRGVARSGLRDWLVLSQIAIAVPLVFASLLFGRSFAALLNVRPGFSSEGVLTMHLAVSRARYPKDREVAEYYRRIEERIKALPGIAGAGLVNRLPMSGLEQTGGVEFEGKDGAVMTDWRSATPGYFGAIGIPVLRGRGLADSDRADGPPVGLIDSELARRVFGEQNPVGSRFRRSGPPGKPNGEPWSVVVGVVGHVRNDNLERDPRPQVYWPETQRTQDRAALVVRTAGPPAPHAAAVIEQIRHEDPDQPVYEVRTMDSWIAQSTQTRRLSTGLVTLFGTASLALACLGLYGVISYSAGLRLREFGIRMALGATAATVRVLVLRQAGRLVGLGVAAGLALCWPAGIVLRRFLFGVGNLDAVSWLAAPALLMMAGLLAALGPALRVSAADPARTLRAE